MILCEWSFLRCLLFSKQQNIERSSPIYSLIPSSFLLCALSFFAVAHTPWRSTAFSRVVDDSLAPLVPSCPCPQVPTFVSAMVVGDMWTCWTHVPLAGHSDSWCSPQWAWGSGGMGPLVNRQSLHPVSCPGPEKLLDCAHNDHSQRRPGYKMGPSPKPPLE